MATALKKIVGEPWDAANDCLDLGLEFEFVEVFVYCIGDDSTKLQDVAWG